MIDFDQVFACWEARFSVIALRISNEFLATQKLYIG